MRIGLDLRMLGGGSGIDRYISELSTQILTQDNQNDYVLFVRNEKASEPFRRFKHKIVIADIAHYSFAEEFRLPGILRREKLDLVHFPHFNVPLFFNQPFIVTIHDLTHTLFPGRKKSHFFHRLAYHAVFNHAIYRSRKIIAVSNSTKQQILERFKINAEKIQVIYEGFNNIYKMMDKEEAFRAVSEKFGIRKPFLLYVGVWRRYKNLPILVQAFQKLKQQGLDLELVIAGEPDPFYPEIQKSVRAGGEKVRALGRVSDEDLKLLYNAARVFVLPSFMEGFGLTALEAAACGTPIVCSDIPTLREVLGQGAAYFDPHNLENITEVLRNVLSNETHLEELANLALSRSKHFSWQEAGRETIKAYAEALR